MLEEGCVFVYRDLNIIQYTCVCVCENITWYAVSMYDFIVYMYHLKEIKQP